MSDFVSLITSDEDEYGDVQEYEFTVDGDWFVSEFLDNWEYSTVEEFLNNYTSDESSEVYSLAALTGHLAQIMPC